MPFRHHFKSCKKLIAGQNAAEESGEVEYTIAFDKKSSRSFRKLAAEVRRMPMGEKFNIAYADPPWKFQTYSERGSQLKSADCHYSCMKFKMTFSLFPWKALQQMTVSCFY